MILFPAQLAALGSEAETINSYSESNYDTDNGMSADGFTQRGQALNLSKSQVITGLKFYFKKKGTPTGNVVAKIYKTTGTVGTDAKPTGTALATSDTLDISTLTTSYILHEFEFVDLPLLSSGDFAFAIEYPDGDVSNRLKVEADGSSPTADGNIFNNDAGVNTFACCFYLYGY